MCQAAAIQGFVTLASIKTRRLLRRGRSRKSYGQLAYTLPAWNGIVALAPGPMFSSEAEG